MSVRSHHSMCRVAIRHPIIGSALIIMMVLVLCGCAYKSLDQRISLPAVTTNTLSCDITYLRKIESIFLEQDNKGRLTTVYASSYTFDDQAMSHLRHACQLKSLALLDSTVTDAGLLSLKGKGALESLALIESLITDEGIRLICELENLRYLDVQGTKITDGSVKYLTRLRELRFLCVKQTRLSEGKIRRLKESLPQCEIEY